jgi:hypothetical protein
VVAGDGPVVAIGFKMSEKGQNQVSRKMLNLQRFDFDAKMIGRKGQKQAEGIPIGFDGLITAALDANKVLIEKLINTGGKFHLCSFCDLAKQNNC